MVNRLIASSSELADPIAPGKRDVANRSAKASESFSGAPNVGPGAGRSDEVEQLGRPGQRTVEKNDRSELRPDRMEKIRERERERGRERGKMADAKLVVSNALCYIVNKYGKSDQKHLRDIVSDFYDSEELGKAKTQLIDDIRSVMSSPASLPYIPTRGDGDNKAVRITDDILTMITFADENLLTRMLPRYVADNVDRLPSARLYEGDMAMLVGLVKKLEGRVGQFDGQLTAILKVIHEVGLEACQPSSLRAAEWPALNENTVSGPTETSRSGIDTSAAGSGQTTIAYCGARSADQSAQQASSTVRPAGTNWQ